VAKTLTQNSYKEVKLLPIGTTAYKLNLVPRRPGGSPTNSAYKAKRNASKSAQGETTGMVKKTKIKTVQIEKGARATEQQIESDQATPALMFTALKGDTSTKHNSNCYGSIILPPYCKTLQFALKQVIFNRDRTMTIITKITTLGCHAPLAYRRVHSLAVSTASASFAFQCFAMLSERGSSGFGALSSAWMLNRTVRI